MSAKIVELFDLNMMCTYSSLQAHRLRVRDRDKILGVGEEKCKI